MTCDQSAQIHAYHDGALPADAIAALDAHLAGCVDCSALLSDLRGLSHLIDVAPIAAMPPEVMARIGLNLRAARERGLLRMTGWLTGAAAAVLVGALWLYPERGSVDGTGHPAAQAWHTLAVMPPAEPQDENPPEVALAMWMANDLAVGERQR